MSIGAPSNLGTLLIQRLDAVLGTTLGQQANLATGARPTAVTQAGNPENPDALQNPAQRHPREAVDAAGAQGRGQTAIGKPLGASALDDRMGRATTYHNATASAPTTLGFAARIILALLAQYPQADPAARGRAPLLPGQAASPGAAPPAATAPASGQTAAAGSAPSQAPGPQGPTGASGGAPAAAPAPPGALAAQLVRSLSLAVQGSGLFYESHLAALAFGKTDALGLAREPQAHLGAQTPAGAGSGPSAQIAHPQGTPATANESASTANTATGHTAAQTQAQTIPGIDPQAHLLVRQQLEVLANQAFVWQGEAWPGAGMRWEISRRARDDEDGDGSQTGHWSTRLNLSLPALGEVQARLTLAGDQLVMRLTAPNSAGRLDGAIEALRTRLLAQGLRASQIAVGVHDDTPPANPAPAMPVDHDPIHPA
uniref:flagellar hook-length control protein FliK n=1 Tax=Castellaniella defragrans TaxID=75697 RepID=UPI00333F66B0